MQEKAVKVVHPGYFDKYEEEDEEAGDKEAADKEQDKKEDKEWDGEKNGKDVQEEEKENIQDVKSLCYVASVYRLTLALNRKI